MSDMTEEFLPVYETVAILPSMLLGTDMTQPATEIPSNVNGKDGKYYK